MKKIVTLTLTALLALTLMIPAAFAIEEGDPLQIIIHYKNEHIDWNEVGIGEPILVKNTIVLKDLGFDLPLVPEYGYSEFATGFTSEDDFGKIFTFTAGYKETDVTEVYITYFWQDITAITIPINLVDEDGKIEAWVIADGPGGFLLEEGAEPGATTFQVVYEAPEGFPPFDPAAAVEPTPAEEEPSPEEPSPEEPSPEEPSPTPDEPSPTPDEPAIDEPAIEEPSPADPVPLADDENEVNIWLWVGIGAGVLILLVVVAVFATRKKK
ncbi:MAG: hypothetical protein LBR76_09040 [Oscillospiraceae bacterium]|jgi:hypothetical protein|nr:hypothetical protein [Oscillospiraceae bacterium]